jgi:hypothetical protein
MQGGHEAGRCEVLVHSPTHVSSYEADVEITVYRVAGGAEQCRHARGR